MAKYVKKTYRNPQKDYLGTSASTEYQAWGNNPVPYDRIHWNDSDKRYEKDRTLGVPNAQVIVNHASYETNFTKDPFGNLEVNPYRHVQGEPTTLFEETPATLSIAMTHSNMRHAVPTLLAMAKRDFPGMVVSHDLSPHSSRLAKRGIAMGVVGAPLYNKGADVSNSLTFSDNLHMHNIDKADPEFSDVPEHDVKESKMLLRSMLRPAKPEKEHMGPQFEHPQLPGVSW